MKTATIVRRDLKKYQCGICEHWYEESEGYHDSEYGWTDGQTAAGARKAAMRCEAEHWDFDASPKARRAVVAKLSLGERLKRFLPNYEAANASLRDAKNSLAQYDRDLQNIPAIVAAQQKRYDEYVAAEIKDAEECKARGEEWLIICGTSSGAPVVETLERAEDSVRRGINYAIEGVDRAAKEIRILEARKKYLERGAKA